MPDVAPGVMSCRHPGLRLPSEGSPAELKAKLGSMGFVEFDGSSLARASSLWTYMRGWVTLDAELGPHS